MRSFAAAPLQDHAWSSSCDPCTSPTRCKRTMRPLKQFVWMSACAFLASSCLRTTSTSTTTGTDRIASCSSIPVVEAILPSLRRRRGARKYNQNTKTNALRIGKESHNETELSTEAITEKVFQEDELDSLLDQLSGWQDGVGSECNDNFTESNAEAIGMADDDEIITEAIPRKRRWNIFAFRRRRHFQRTQNRMQKRQHKQQQQRHQLDLALLSNSTLPSYNATTAQHRWNIFRQRIHRRTTKFLDQTLSSLLQKLLSTESSQALAAIRKIVDNFESDHGVVDVFAQYSTREVLLSGLALGRLQKAAAIAEERRIGRSGIIVSGTDTKGGDALISTQGIGRFLGLGSSKTTPNPSHNSTPIDPALLELVANYAPFAVSAYGWKGRALLGLRLHFGNVQALISRTGIDKKDIVDANWRSRTHRPAYFIVRDRKRKRIILSVRGTWNVRDLLTDLCATAENYEIGSTDTGRRPPFRFRRGRRGQRRNMFNASGDHADGSPRAHQGMVQSAREIARVTAKTIQSELKWHPDYQLVIVGHSLGGGISAVLGSIWKETFPDLTVVAYGCPCVGPIDTEPTTNRNIISICADGDPFSVLSIGHLADLSKAVAHLCDHPDVRDKILSKTKGSLHKMTKADLRFCHEKMLWLRRDCMIAEKLYPPGRILFMQGSNFFLKGNGKDLTLCEATPSKFREMTIHPRMFDLSQHIPTRYESALITCSERATSSRNTNNNRID